MNKSLDPRKNPMGFACGLVGAMFVATSVFMYMLFVKEPYLTYENLPFPTVLETITPGEVMPIRVVRCNADKVPHNYMTTRSLERVDARADPLEPQFVLLQPSMASIAPGCHTSTSLLNKLPEHVPSGKYRLIGTAEVRTPFRSHTVEWHSQPFMVTQKK